MTYASDPPRLRALARRLPSELALALGSLHDQEASVPELEQLALSVRSRAAFAPSSGMPPRKAPRRWRRIVVFHGALGLVMLFALGAAAGVLVVTGLFFGFRWSGPHSGTPTSSTSGPAPVPKAPASPGRAPASSAAIRAPLITDPAPMPSLAPSAASVATTRASSPSPPPESGAEFSLVSRAQASLAADPVRALALVSDHERQFPNGTLVEECEMIAIDALLRLGRRLDAEARATRFRERFPASLHRRRLDVLLGDPTAAPSRPVERSGAKTKGSN